jgi:hypothetical protein
MNIIASIWLAQIWYAVPLMIVISLVYGATRHEYLKEIIRHSISAFAWLLVFLGVIFLLVWWGTSLV